MRSDKGYKLPDIKDPAESQCIRVYVPDDPLYLAAFWGSYEFLANWLAWERDDSQGGKAAAARWRDDFERSRSEYLCQGGCCGMTDIRQQVSAPCLIEKLADCSGDWEVAVDMRLCVPKMRTVGGVLQQDTTGAGNWVNAGDPEAPYDDRTDGAYSPAWEIPPVGEDGACLAALNAIAFARSAVTTYCDMNDVLLDFLANVLWFIARMQVIAEVKSITTVLIGDFLTLVEGFLGDWAVAADYDFTADVLCIIQSAYSSDGSMTGEGWASIGAAIQDVIDDKVSDEEKQALRVASLVFFALGPVGMSRVANFAGIVTGDCSECVEWEHIVDFTTGMHGWTIPTYQGQPMGTWVEGVGVKAVWNLGYYRAEADMPALGAAVLFSRAGAEFHFVQGDSNYKSRHVVLQDGVSEVWRYVNDAGTTEITSGYVEGGANKEGDWFYAYQTDNDGQTHNPGDVGDSHIKEIRIYGRGDNPFE